MKLELLSPRSDREHHVVQLIERRSRPQQCQTRSDPRDVRVDGDVPHPEREQKHARCRLTTDAGEADQIPLSLVHRLLRQPVE